jgi:hypothetical protein
MSPSDLHDDGAPHAARSNGFSDLQSFRWVAGIFRFLHHAIVGAKLRRLERELMFRHDYSELLPPDQEVAKFPQHPLVLGDKRDF